MLLIRAKHLQTNPPVRLKLNENKGNREERNLRKRAGPASAGMKGGRRLYLILHLTRAGTGIEWGSESQWDRFPNDHCGCYIDNELSDIKYPLPGGTSGKESVCQCRRCKRPRFDPWVGKIPWSRKWQPTVIFLPGKFHRQRSLVGYSPWGRKELDTMEWLRTQTHTMVQGLAQDEDTETDRIGQGFKSLINRTQWWILKKGWGKRHQKLTCSCLIWPSTKQLRWTSACRIQFLEGWIEKKQDSQAWIGGKTALFEISFVQLSFRTKNSSFYWHGKS